MKLRSRPKGIVRAINPQYWGSGLSTVFFLILALAFFAVSALSPSNLSSIRTQTVDFLTPALTFITAPVQDAFAFIEATSGIAAMRAENIRLKAENEKLLAWYQTALTLQEKNAELQKLLNVKIDPQHSYVTARVIADSGNAYVKSFLVLASKRDGIAKGQAVLGKEGVVGRVVEAGQKASRVLLLTDVNSRIPVLIEGKNWHAVIAGRNNEDPALEHLSSEAELKEGMRVITSGHGGVFPYGLPVGVIRKAKDGQNFISLYENTDKLTHVRIVDKKTDVNLNAGGL